MKISELQKRVADVLGVSISQKELSFDIFIETISEILDHGITLKVPRIGFFQLKKNTSKIETGKILFSPLPEDYSQDMRNLYLTIDISPKRKNNIEFDSHIFSIGVGKPLLPLTADEIPDMETSNAMLKKSIEERVRELISESDQIPNFNIWDDYYKSPDDFEEKSFNETQSRFNQLTSDLEFKEITVQHNLHPGFFEDYLTSKENSQTPEIENVSSKLMQNETKDRSEEKDEINYWPKINDEHVIDFDNIQSRIDQEINESENSEQLVSKDDKQEDAIEHIIDEDGVDYSKVETGTIDDTKDSSLTLANLLDDNSPNNQIPEEETNLAEDYVLTDEIHATEQINDEEKILAEEELEMIDQSDPGIVYDGSKMVEEPLEEVKEITTEENPESVDKSVSEINPDEPEKVEEPLEEVKEITTEENPESVDKSESEINQDEPEKVEESDNSQNLEELEKTEIADTIGTKEEVNETEKIDEVNESYKFAELEKIIDDEKAGSSTQDTNEEKRKTNEKYILNDDTESEDETFENTGERIEWNWGDELREEFGITKELNEEQMDENTSDYDNLDDDLELIDEPIETDKRFTKDLFKELEKTLERDKLFDDIPARKRSTIVEYPNETNRTKKIFLEFSSPPTRYEFIEDRRVEREKRMAISLVEEDDRRFVPTIENQPTPEKSDTKEKYFGKTFLIIISIFVIVTATIILFVLRPNNKDVQQGSPGINQQKDINEVQDNPSDKNTVSQTQTKIEPGSQQKNVSTSPLNEELSDFPISAAPPVAIKNGTGEQNDIIEKKSTAKKDLKQPASKQTPTTANAGNKSELNETRIGTSIYTDGKTFNYQTSSWKNKQKAEQEIKRLRGLGLNAYMLEVYLPQKGGTWYRVRVGSFKSQKEAENSMKQNNF